MKQTQNSKPVTKAAKRSAPATKTVIQDSPGTPPQSPLTRIRIIGLIGLVIAIGIISWVIISGNRTKSMNVTSENQIGASATKGLRQAGTDTKDSDLIVRDTDTVLNQQTPPSTARAGKASVSMDIIDSRGYSYNGMSNFQIIVTSGKTYDPVEVIVKTTNVAISDCAISQIYAADEDNPTPVTKLLASSNKQRIDAYDGTHSLKATCKSNGATLTAGIDFRISDGMPKMCKGWSFANTAITATSFESLKSGMTGTWVGCVKTPWVPAYYVTMHFNADGTYSAVTNEVLDGVEMNAMYYGTQQDSPEKRYTVNNFQSDGTGTGEIAIVFGPGNINMGTIKNIRLMDNKLSFDFYHRNSYGPLTYQLVRQ